MKRKRQYTSIAWRPFLANGNGQQKWVCLEADLDDLLTWLGGKAKQSKNGRSQLGSGALRAVIRDRKPR